MQGNMWVESDPGVGSSFFFTLTSDIAQPSRDTLLEKLTPFDNRTILYLETQPDGSRVAARLEDMGLRSFTVHDVGELAKKDVFPHIDSIIIDSVEATESIRQLEHLRYIPVVILTAPSSTLNCAYPPLRPLSHVLMFSTQ
jgi:osomolarity two-component system sensor histidine kinase NIK1